MKDVEFDRSRRGFRRKKDGIEVSKRKRIYLEGGELGPYVDLTRPCTKRGVSGDSC